MNFSFGKNKNKENNKVSIIFDIRSASVGAAIVSQTSDDVPLIKYATRETVYFEQAQDLKNFTTKIYNAFDKVLEDIHQNGIKNSAHKNKLEIQSINCVMASPWYKSKLKNFSINEKKPVNFTKNYLNELLKKEEQTEKIPANHSLLEKKIISVYMNGYETEDPFNKKAKSIQLSFYTSYINSKIQKDFNEKIANKLNFKKTNFYTHPYVIISVIKNIFHSSTNFLLIDVGGEVTDIGLFKNGVLENLVSIPSGTHYFVREIATKCSLDKNIAFSKLNMLITDKLDKECNQPAEKILQDAKSNWLRSIKGAIEKDWQKEKIPAIVFITVDNEARELIKNIFTEKEIYSVFNVNRQPIVHLINSDSIKNFCEYAPGIKKDSLLSTISEFIILENQ